MKERLQKIISGHGICSRRAAEKLIADGRVKLNGAVAEIGMSADIESDIIEVDGKVLGDRPELVYILLNKPRGVLTTSSDDRGRKTVVQLVDCGERVYPVGRLDLTSEGLLVLTNDGDVARALTHPSGGIEKTYRVTVEPFVESKVEELAALDELDGEPINPAKVTVVQQADGRAKLEIVINQGKNRQIRRMCEAVGMDVHRLKRTRIGELKLAGLRPGEWRYMEKEEIRWLKGLAKSMGRDAK